MWRGVTHMLLFSWKTCVRSHITIIMLYICFLFLHTRLGGSLNSISTGGHLCNLMRGVMVVTCEGQTSGLRSGRDVWLWAAATAEETHSSALFREQTETPQTGAAELQLLIYVCASFTPHSLKVTIVMMVLLLYTGGRVGARADWTPWPPRVSRCFRFVRTRMRSDPSLLIFYLLPKPKMAPVNASVP